MLNMYPKRNHYCLLGMDDLILFEEFHLDSVASSKDILNVSYRGSNYFF